MAVFATISDAGGNWSSTSTWVDGVVPNGVDDQVYSTATSGNLVIDGNYTLNTITLTNYTGTLSGTGNLNITSDCVLGASMTYTHTGKLGMIGAGGLQTNGIALYQLQIGRDHANTLYPDTYVEIYAPLTVQDFNHAAGTFNTQNNTINTASFAVQSHASTVCQLGSSIINVYEMASNFGPVSVSIYTPITPGTSTINFTIPTSSNGNGDTHYFESNSELWDVNIMSDDTTGTNLISGFGHTNNEPIAMRYITIGPNVNIVFQPQIFYFDSFSAIGTDGNLITLTGPTTLTVDPGPVTCDYLSLTNIIADGTAVFNAGANSIDGGGNIGWFFPPPVVVAKRYFLPCSNPVANINGFKMEIISSYNDTTPDEFRLPLTSEGTYNFTVNWGDGTSDIITAWDQPEVTHQYSPSGTYDVTITGTCTDLRFSTQTGGPMPWDPPAPWPKMVTKLKQTANIGLIKLDFGNCINLTSLVPLGNQPGILNLDSAFAGLPITSIPAGLLDGCINVTSINNLFGGCSSLMTIPNDLFKNMTQVTQMNGVFSNCSALTTIPSDLFRYNTQVTTMSGLFSGCTSLQTVPVDTFRYNTLNTDFSALFSGCSLLSSIPTDLFRYCPLVTTFDLAFAYGTTSLTSIPVDTFRYNTAVERFDSTWYYGGLVTLPDDIFRYNTAVTTFRECFGWCEALESVGPDLFRYNTNCLEFTTSLEYCHKLQLRSDMFFRPGEEGTRFLNQNVKLDGVFLDNTHTGLQGTAPALWTCDFGTGTPVTTGCFSGDGNNATSISNYNDIPLAWGGTYTPPADVLLLHLDGTAGDTFTTDEYGHTIEFVGGAVISGSEPKFPGTSLRLPSNGLIKTPANPDFNFGTGDFTIDFYFNPVNLDNTVGLLSSYANGDDRMFALLDTAGNISMTIYSGGSLLMGLQTTSAPVMIQTWKHFAFVRSGTNFYIFYEGVLQPTSGTQLPENANIPNFADLAFGGIWNQGENAINNPANGWIDEIRVRKGEAVWTTNFTPPQVPYTP